MTRSRPTTLALIALAWLLRPFVPSAPRTTGEAPRIFVAPQLSRVGDVVCATPVFRALKERYPSAHLAVLVSRKVSALLRHNPHIDEIIEVESHSFFALVRLLRQRHFDWGVSLAGVSTVTLLMLFARIPGRIKTVRSEPPPTERLTDRLATHRVHYAHHTYLPAHYLRTLAPLDVRATDTRPEVFATPAGEERAAAFVAQALGKPMVGLSVTAGNKIKEWGDERFVELARALHARHDVALAVIGGPADRARVEAVIRAIGTGVNLAATDFPLEELPSLMKRLALFIAVDTGPIYIAYALATPLVDIIGPVDPAEQPPRDERSVQVLPAAGTLPTSFVLKRAGPPAAHARAVASISVAQVLEAAEGLAARTGCLGRAPAV